MSSLVGLIILRFQKGLQHTDSSIPTSTPLPTAFQDSQPDSVEASAEKPEQEDPVNAICLHEFSSNCCQFWGTSSKQTDDVETLIEPQNCEDMPPPAMIPKKRNWKLNPDWVPFTPEQPVDTQARCSTQLDVVVRDRASEPNQISSSDPCMVALDCRCFRRSWTLTTPWTRPIQVTMMAVVTRPNESL